MSGSIDVLWSVRAKRSLRAVLGPGDEDADRSEAKHRIETLLRSAFGDRSLVVRDRFSGFNPDRNLHIFEIEVLSDPDWEGTYVVKIGPPEALHAELENWRRCKPVGLRHDIVLLPLDEGLSEATIVGNDGTDPGWTIIVYGDAQQLISIEPTCWFEEAAIESIRFGTPDPESVRGILTQVYERIGHLLYEGAAERRPASLEHIPHGERSFGKSPRFESGLACWSTEEMAKLRAQVGQWVPAGVDAWLDPVSSFEAFSEMLTDPDRWQLDSEPTPDPSAVLPALLHGRGHGDLHGRNLLVGRVRDRVLFPAVFDYEDMGTENVIGWDFVKMEVEIKIRAYDAILPRMEPRYCTAIAEFETDLAVRTERHFLDGSWSEVRADDDGSPLGRLRQFVLAIRFLAAMHLGQNRGRSRRWLQEYLFLLGCYAVHSGRFQNLERRHLLASLIGSGVAVARLDFVRERGERERSVVQSLTENTEHPPEIDTLCRMPFFSHEPLRALAQEWVHSRVPERVDAATDLLRGLICRFPGVLPIRTELCFAQLEAGRVTEAVRTLDEAGGQMRFEDEETLCRRGRLYKDAGDAMANRQAESSTGLSEADRFFDRAMDCYGRAWEVRQGHYPGINRATISLLRGALARRRAELSEEPNRRSEATAEADRHRGFANRTAGELIACRSRWPRDRDDDNIWHLATLGEAHLIRGEFTEAEAAYRDALTQPNRRNFHAGSMGRQANRILSALERFDILPPEGFGEVFGTD